MFGNHTFKIVVLSIFLGGAFLFLPINCYAQGEGDAGSLTTSQLQEKLKDLLKDDNPESLIPYLREMLLRVEGRNDTDGKDARAFCMYQIGVSEMQLKRYPDAIKSFDAFIKMFPKKDEAKSASLFIAELYARTQNWEGAEKYAQTLLDGGSLLESQRMSTLQLYGEALYSQEKWSEAVVPLRQVFDMSDEFEVRNSAALMLVTCYVKEQDFDNFLKFLNHCDDSIRQNAALNVALIEAGDQKFKEGDYANAIVLYRTVLRGEERISIYEKQIADLKKFISTPYVTRVGTSRSAHTEKVEKSQIELNQKKKELDAVRSGKGYDADLELRIGQCYSSMKRKIPASTLFKLLYAEYPNEAAAEEARFYSLAVLLEDLELDAAVVEAVAYLKAYPMGKFTDEVTLNLMQIYLQNGKVDEAQEVGFQAVQQFPNHKYMDQIKYLIGYTYFQKIEYMEALGTFQEVYGQWPTGMYREASEYWMAMSRLFLGHFNEAADAFKTYLRNPEYEKRNYAEDSSYRLGIALYGAGKYEEAESIFLRFIDTYAGSTLESEALSMLGDLRGAEGDLELALEYYEKALDVAASIDQVNYATFQSAKTYELQGNHTKIISMMEAYVSKHGEDGNFAGAGFWIGKSYKALGQNDKAIDKYLQTVVQFGDKLENDDVDLILRELIDETKEGESAASRSALESRLSQELNKARSQHQEILAIRLETLFTYISDGATREKYVKAVFETDVEKAGPLTLLLMATESAARGKADVVHQVYQHCMEKYAESEILVDVMNMELKALLDEEQYKKVETLAEEITNRFGYRAEVGLTRKLKADAYRLTKQSDLAIKTYEELFKVREWRGPLTAESLYWIGVCHYDLGNEQEALAFFKRVAVMYENYTKWMAKANEGAILCLEKKGQTDEIIAICQEILANDEAAATPEGVRARTRLNKLLPQGDAK